MIIILGLSHVKAVFVFDPQRAKLSPGPEKQKMMEALLGEKTDPSQS